LVCEILKKFNTNILHICPPCLSDLANSPWDIQKSFFNGIVCYYSEQGVGNGRVSVRLSVPAACGGFAAERPVGKRYHLTAVYADAQQQ